MDLGLAGKHAIVTGGSRGVGRAVAERLLAEGMSVSICARDPDGVAVAVDEMRAAGHAGDVWGDAVDVADHVGLRAWVARSVERAGGVDVVFTMLPVGANVFLFSQRYHKAEDLVTASVAVSTAMGLVTISVVMALLRHWA